MVERRCYLIEGNILVSFYMKQDFLKSYKIMENIGEQDISVSLPMKQTPSFIAV